MRASSARSCSNSAADVTVERAAVHASDDARVADHDPRCGTVIRAAAGKNLKAEPTLDNEELRFHCLFAIDL